MSTESMYRWHGGALVPLEYCDMTDTTIVAADSWLVTDGQTLALGLHRERFLGSLPLDIRRSIQADEFWSTSIAALPRSGQWFPRVELQDRAGAPLLMLRVRSAPELQRSVTLATWSGEDPRTHPAIKGPDLGQLLRVRTAVQPRGAGEAILLNSDGFVVEGTSSAILWWRGQILCAPPAEFERIPSVTARSLLAIAVALGVETHEEAVTPSELEGTELWVLSALHGIRIATAWVDGPELAELPGRLASWRARMDALRRPI